MPKKMLPIDELKNKWIFFYKTNIMFKDLISKELLKSIISKRYQIPQHRYMNSSFAVAKTVNNQCYA